MHIGNAGPFLHKLTIARQGVKEISVCSVHIAKYCLKANKFNLYQDVG